MNYPYKSGLVHLGDYKFYYISTNFLYFFEPPLLLTITITMVKMKGRKKPFPWSSAVLRTESQALNDAHDNPGTIPEVERLSSIRDDPIALRRSPRLCLMEARIVRNDSEQNMNEFILTGSAGNSAREHNDGTRSADA